MSQVFLLELHISTCQKRLRFIMCKTKLTISFPPQCPSFSSVLNLCEQCPVQLVIQSQNAGASPSPPLFPYVAHRGVLLILSPNVFLACLFSSFPPLQSSAEPLSPLTWTLAVASYLVYLHLFLPALVPSLNS